jgi:hypothetical protein
MSSLLWYSISIKLLSNNSHLFSGRFSVNTTTNAIIHFVNSNRTNVNIIGYFVDNYQADNKFDSGKFTFKGIVINKINAALEKKYNAIAWNLWYSDGLPNLSYLRATDKMWYDIVDNSKNYGTTFGFTISPLAIAPNPKTIPRNVFTKMHIKIIDKNTSTNVFTGSFVVDIISRVVSLFTNYVAPTIDILAYTADDNYSDYKFITNNINQFTMAGTAITSIPALDSIYSASQWQFWNYNGVNSLSYKNASNEWKAITPLDNTNRYSIVISNKKFV